MFANGLECNMEYFKDRTEASEAAKYELEQMFARHEEADRDYSDNNRWKTFQLHWEPKRVIYNEFQEQISVYITGKKHQAFEVVLSKMDDKGRSHVKQAYEECKDITMQDLGDRSEYKLFSGRISNHYSHELKMRETEIEFVYWRTPELLEVITLWCGGSRTIWSRHNQKGHFKIVN